jgi:uncharacterized membrane-anchored protein
MERRFVIPMAIALVIFAGFFLYAAMPSWMGTEVQLRLVPVDPTDVFRGEYLTLRYDISNFDSTLPKDYEFESGQKIYVSLSNDQVAHAVRYSHQRPTGLFLIGNIEYGWFLPVGRENEASYNIRFPIDRYYIPEGTGGAVENFRNGNYTALVKIDSRGNARVMKILRDGREVKFNYEPQYNGIVG